MRKKLSSKKQLNSAKMHFQNSFDPAMHGKIRHGDVATVILYNMIEKFHERKVEM